MNIKNEISKCSDEKFIEAVRQSSSIRQVLLALNQDPSGGGGYRVFHSRVKRLNVDTSHFTGQGHLRDKTHNWNVQVPLEEVLVENSDRVINSRNKKKLIEQGILELKCYNMKCNISDEWLGSKITLQLDHVNGDNTDNRKENLRLLCPNCHSQTETFCRRKDSRNKPEASIEEQRLIRNEGDRIRRANAKVFHCECGIQTKGRGKKCISCTRKGQEKISWPSDEELLKMVQDTSFLATAKKLGVSDNAVRKRLRQRDMI